MTIERAGLRAAFSPGRLPLDTENADTDVRPSWGRRGPDDTGAAGSTSRERLASERTTAETLAGVPAGGLGVGHFDSRASRATTARSLDSESFSTVDRNAIHVSNACWTSISISRSLVLELRFSDCQLTNVHFELCSLRNIRFERCKLAHCRFSYSRLSKFSIEHCSVSEVELLFCSLHELKFDDSIPRQFQPGYISSRYCSPGHAADDDMLERIGWQKDAGSSP